MKNKNYPYYDVAEPKDLKDLMSYISVEYQDKLAFWYRTRKEEVRISYKQFAQDVAALGTFFIHNGFKNKHIAVLGENSYEWVVAYFAIVNSGNIVVPIDKEATPADIKKQVLFSDIEVLLHSDIYTDIAEYCEIRSINLKLQKSCIEQGQSIIENGDDCFSNVDFDVNETCAIVFTSGTTSDPKGVMLSHKNVITDAIISSKNLLVPEGTVALLPFYHTFGFMACVICQLIRGYPVFINSSLKRAFDDIKMAKPKHISVVPMLLVAIYNKIWENARKNGKEKLLKSMIKISNLLLTFKIDIRRKLFKQVFDAFGGNLEMLITGGASIDEKYIKGFEDFGIKVINGYGITECSPIVATTRNRHYVPSSAGKIQPGVKTRVVDGEILIKGDIVFKGYYKNEQATKDAFDNGWFKTGDLGKIDENGLLYITGRKKNIIILSNGKNVIPEEIECVLSSSILELKEVLVYGENDMIVCEIYPDCEIENVQEKIKEQIYNINRTLPAYKEIAKIKFRDTEFPKTTTKKIKRNLGGQQNA